MMTSPGTLWLAALLCAVRPIPQSAADALDAIGVEGPRRVVAFETTESVARWAHDVAASSHGGAAAEALYQAIIAWKRAGAIEADRDNVPTARLPKTAAKLHELASRPDAPGDRRAGCYELTVVFIAGARALGLDAVGLEPIAIGGTGQIGHVMAAVREPSGRLAIYDLQNERRLYPGATRTISERRLAAHHYNHLAVSAYLRGDLVGARWAIDIALRMDPDSAAFSNNRASIIGALGELEVAIADATFAVSLAPRVAHYRYQLGRLLLAAGRLPAAQEALQHALSLRPGYAVALRDLGWVLLLGGDPDGARRSLSRAVQIGGVPKGRTYLALALVILDDSAAASAVVQQGGAQADPALDAIRELIAGEPIGPEARRLGQLVRAVKHELTAARGRSGAQ